MKTKLLVLLLLGASSVFGANFYFGIGVNVGPRAYVVAPPPPPPPVVRYVRPRSPGRAYVWIPGYWSLAGPNYRWTTGYWSRPPRAHARWVAPRYVRGRYYGGYWR